MALTSEDIADLIVATQKDLGRMKFTDIASPLQEYVVMPNLLKKKRVEFSAGQGIQWNLMYDSNGQARWTGLYEVDNYNVNDVLKTANIPWRHSTVNYSIEEREIAMNGAGETRVLELIKVRRAAAMLDLAKLWESAFFNTGYASGDSTKIYPIDAYIVKNSSTGFNGGNPSAFSSGVGGVNSSTYTRWANYTYQFTNMTRTDGIRGWKKATRQCRFIPPMEVPEYGTKGLDYAFYTADSIIATLDELIEDQNENLGSDLYSQEGSLMFRRAPVIYAPALDADAQTPIYGINWNKMKFVFLSGEYMNESKPRQAPNQHRVQVVDVDCTANLLCWDRRSQFILNIA